MSKIKGVTLRSNFDVHFGWWKRRIRKKIVLFSQFFWQNVAILLLYTRYVIDMDVIFNAEEKWTAINFSGKMFKTGHYIIKHFIIVMSTNPHVS